MGYTDKHGRPEIVPDPGLKLGPAAYRIETPPAAAPGRPTGDGGGGAGTGRADLCWPHCEHAC